MAEASISTPEIARRNETAIRRAVGKAESQKALALAMDVSEATVNRLLNDHLMHFAQLLAQLGQKVVPVEARVVSNDAYDFMTKTHARVIERNPDLVWGSGE